MKNVSYTKIFSALIASGLFVFTLTNSSVVFSQASESSGLGEVFKKVEQFELLAAVGDPQTPATQGVTELTRAQVLDKLFSLLFNRPDNGLGNVTALEAVLQSFLNTTEGKAQQALFLEVAKEQMPREVNLIGKVAINSGFDAALVTLITGYVDDTGAGDDAKKPDGELDGASQNRNPGAGGAPNSPTNAS